MDLTSLDAQQAPYHIKYSQLQPLGLSAYASKVAFYPQNAGTFNNTNNNVIRIPISSQTSFLDGALSYLKVKVVATPGAGRTARLDNSAHSLFKSIRIISKSGSDLEYLREYAQLHAMLSDIQLSTDERLTRSAFEGYGYNGVLRGPVLAGAGIVAGQLAIPAITGTSLGTDEVVMANNGTATFCLPLLSSILGSAAQKYWPLFLSGDLMLELVLNPNATFSDDPAGLRTFNITECVYHGHLVRFDGVINETLKAMMKQTGLFISGHSWSSHYNALAGGVSNILVTEKLKSIKSIFFHFNGTPADSTERSLARNNASLTSFKLKIGSEYYPNQSVSGDATSATNNAEFIAELYKAIGEWNNNAHTSIINAINFASNDDTVASCGRAVYGLDVDAFGRAALESGVNSVLNPITVEFTPSLVAPLNSYVHLLFDQIYIIRDDGVVTVSKN